MLKMEMTNARDEDVPMTKGELVCARFDITGYSRGSLLVDSRRRSILMLGVCAMEEANPPGEGKDFSLLFFFFFIPKNKGGNKRGGGGSSFLFCGAGLLLWGVIGRRFTGRRDVAGRGRRRLAW